MRDSRNRPSAVTSDPAIGKSRYRPVLLTTLPLKIDAHSSPTTIGSVRTPAKVAESPSTYCR
jgi:hypothetical protein